MINCGKVRRGLMLIALAGTTGPSIAGDLADFRATGTLGISYANFDTGYHDADSR